MPNINAITPDLYDISTPEAIADSLGEARAELSAAKAAVELLESLIKNSDLSEINGEAYRVTVSHSRRRQTDWKTVAEKLAPSTQLVVAHTRYVPVSTVRCTALTK